MTNMKRNSEVRLLTSLWKKIYYLLYSEMYDQKLKEIKDDMTIEK